MFEIITTTEWLRIAFLYSHLIVCAFAITTVLKTDIELVLGDTSPESLASTATLINRLLIALWMTGLAIVYLDTGFSPDALISKPKLVLKLLCAITLTINGIVLHHYSFAVLVKPANTTSFIESVLLVTTGAISTSHWMLAVLVGLSKPLGRLPLSTLIASYAVFFIAVLSVSVFFIPLLSNVKRNYSLEH